MTYGGASQTVELDEKLNGNSKSSGDEQEANLTPGEANPIHQGYRQHSQAGEEETVEHHVLHAHLVERQPAEVETCSPEASGEGAGAVAEKGDAPAGSFGADFGLCHSLFYCRIWRARPTIRETMGAMGYLPSREEPDGGARQLFCMSA